MEHQSILIFMAVTLFIGPISCSIGIIILGFLESRNELRKKEIEKEIDRLHK